MLNAGDFLQNRYEIINCIGTGGMADVYKARDHKLNRYVAIKVMKAEFRGDREFVSKFRVEAQAAAGLAHQNIVNVYDVGDENGIYFIVMELVEGITLKTYILNRGKLSVREATGISLQVAAGLEAAHNNGIIHRDVKPQNIIISTDGTAKVADFGIARAASADTINSNVMGSVHYSAPEQSRGGYCDAKSDIYSLGITMYEMLTGHVPFDGDSTVEVALKHLQNEIVAPKDVIPDLPNAINQIILKCTQKSPDRRYQNMSQLIRDLKESLVDPNGDFVTASADHAAGATHKYSRQDLEEINRRSADYQELFDDSEEGGELSEDEDAEYDRYLDYDDEDFDPDEPLSRERGRKRRKNTGSGKSRSEKLITVISVAAALVVGIAIVYLLVNTFDKIKRDNDSLATENESTLIVDITADAVTVPDIRGMEESQAQQTLKDAGLGYHYLGEVASEEYASGQIASQDKDPGSKVVKNTTIGYQVSIGSAQSMTVPDLTDKTREAAQEALTSMGLNVSIDNTRYSDTVSEGHVITTNPGAGSAVHEGDTVTIYISQGEDSQSVKVPDVVGHYKDDAVTMLSNYSLYVYVTQEPSDTVAEGLVIRQDIPEGTSVQTGTAITITVSSGPADEIVIDPTSTSNGVWKCNAQLKAPDTYSGGEVRITIEQSGIETTVFEGETEFPYILNTEGIAGISTGTAYVYELDSDGNVLYKTSYYPIEFKEVE